MRNISKVDKQLCTYIEEQYKPCIFVVNKWDLCVDTMPTQKWVNYLRDTFRSMWHVPIAFITGQTGKNVKALLNHAQMLFKQAQARVTTADLNKLLRASVERNEPPLFRGRRPKLYFATQVGVAPPTIVVFCSDPNALDHTWRRYLLGALRDEVPYGEVPIKLYLRQRESSPAKAGQPAAGPAEEDE
jgi:GTP-binding protein